MKLALYTDVHFTDKGSAFLGRGEMYSTRLEHVIQSLNWAEDQAVLNNCDAIICLGDFFDASTLTSVEITALNTIKWAENLPHYFVTGNHEGFDNELVFNSANVLKNKGFKVINQSYCAKISQEQAFIFIPYVLEANRKSLTDYFSSEILECNKKFVFSHNDIKGIQYGPFVSKEGFDSSDIEKNCTLFLNGHLHNGKNFCNNGINLGNLCGQNFTEDATCYSHNLYILDTDTETLSPIENPYALNFYKINISCLTDIEKLKELKGNAVLHIKCPEEYKETLENVLASVSRIVGRKISYQKAKIEISKDNKNSHIIDEEYDFVKEFFNFALEKIENTAVLIEELEKIRSMN